MLNTGKYKQYLTLPEAALVWSGLPLDLLADAAYPAPGVPLIVGYPDVTARAEALLEATTHGSLMECGRSDPDIPLPSPERRIVHRPALLEWVKKYWPDELPGGSPPRRTTTVAPTPTAPPTEVADRLLLMPAVLKLVGVSKPTLYRRMGALKFPRPSREKPNRWRASDVQDYIKSTEGAKEDI